MKVIHYVGKNILNVKIILAFIIVCVWSFLYANDYVTAAQMMGNSLNVLEPAIYLLSNKSISAFLFVLCFIFAFCDIPFEDGSLPYYVYRSGYVRWYINILIFTVTIALAFVVLPIIVSIITCVTEGFFSFDVWSQTARLSANGGAPQLSFMPNFTLEIISYSPGVSIFISALNVFLHCIFNALVLLFFNCVAKKIWGIMVLTIIETLGYLLSLVYPKLSEYFPFIRASFMAKGGISDCFLYFGITIFILLVLVWFFIRKYKFESGEAK